VFIQQAHREGGVSFLKTILQDLRFAVRQLRKSPGLAFTAILVFALGIGASTAIFAFVDAALVKPLPYRDPSRLVALFERIPVGDRYHLSYGDYLDWKQLNRVFTSVDIYRPEGFALTAAAGLEDVSGARVSDGFFRTLGIVPFLGRDFRPGEDLKSAQPTVLLSYATWQKRFGANKNVVGETVTLDGVLYLIVGVLPSGFHFAPVEPAEFWTTLQGFCVDKPRSCHAFYGVGRLKEGATVATAYADLSSIARQIAAEYPQSNRDRGATVIPLPDAILGDIRPTLVALLSGAGLLSLIGFVNVSSLLLVRAESRKREIAVRGALGAGRSRLVLQFAVEGFLLASLGCVLGQVISFGLIRVLLGEIPHGLLKNMPYLQGLHFNLHAFLFAFITSLLGGVLFSAGPALQLFLSDMQEGLMEGGRTAAGRSWRKVGASLVVVELAVTVVLLVSAGLFAKSFYRLLHEDIGMSPDHLAVLHVEKLGTVTDAQSVALERQVIARMSTLPGVSSVGVSQRLAVDGGEDFVASFAHFRVAGRPYLGEGDEVNQRFESVGYFETLRARLLRGRYFAETDDTSKPWVGIINQTMARQFFPGEDPLGKHIVDEYFQDHPIEIIGVIDDIKEGPLDMKPMAAVYQAFNQGPSQSFYVTLRASQSEGTLLHAMVNAVRQIDSGLIADGEETMSERINNSQSAYIHRSAAWLVAGFASLALLLGTVGLYGVVSYSVGQRTREIGVRMALGAQRATVYQLILKEACWLATLGITSGILCSVAAANLLRSMLFAVRPWDMATLLSVAIVLAAAAIIASYIPARRAASIAPTEALRSE
jgi:macrolide transport system ATP-binding/permease protein